MKIERRHYRETAALPAWTILILPICVSKAGLRWRPGLPLRPTTRGYRAPAGWKARP
jgi:hypothetical protein